MARRLVTERGIKEFPSRDPKTRKFVVTVAASGKGPDGRRRQFRKTVNGTIQDARRLRNQFEIQAGHSERLANTLTLDEVITLWRERSNHADTTAADYSSVLRKHIPEDLKSRRISMITKLDLDSFLVQMRNKGASNERRLKAYNLLSGAFGYAMMFDLVLANPMTAVERPRAAPPRPRAPDPKTLKAFLDYALGLDDWFGPLVALDAVTGLRRGELCALRWQDLKFVDRGSRVEITVAHSISQTAGHKPRIKSTKTGQIRTISITGTGLSILKDWKRDSPHVQKPDRFIFPSDYEGYLPLRPERVTRQYRRVRDQYVEGGGKAEMLDYNMRHLRNFMITQVVIKHGAAAGANRAGHSNPRTTLTTYAALLPNQDIEIASDIDDAIFGAG